MMLNRVIKDALTYEEIVEQAVLLDPKKSFEFENGSAVAACTSPVYLKVAYGGKTIPLRLFRHEGNELVPTDAGDPQGLYASIYNRVSTLLQADSGWSSRDQIERGIVECIREGWAFRIFSDRGLSGRLSMNDPHAIKSMREKREIVYRQIFNKVFLDTAFLHRFTPLERFLLEQYREKQIQEILSGADGDGVDSEAQDEETVQPMISNGKTRRPTYRPALTYMLSAFPATHHLLISDQSRLCRAAALFMEIQAMLKRHKVVVRGTITNLDFMNDMNNSWAEVIVILLAKIAENQLEDVLLGSMRGILTKLISGRPHGKLPFWLERDKDTDRAVFNSRQKDIRRMVELWQTADETDTERGANAVANVLQQEKILTPGKGRRWIPSTVKYVLSQPTLCGIQTMFGIEWDVMPSVMSLDEFWAMQARLKERADVFSPPKTTGNVYMLAGLLRCSCGETMTYRVPAHGYSTYACTVLSKPREDYDIRHVSINAERIEGFINGLMTYHYDVLLKEWQNNADQDELRAEMQRYAAQAEALRGKEEIRISQERIEVERALESLFHRGTSSFEKNVLNATHDKLAEDEEFLLLRQELNRVEARRQGLLDALARSTPAEEFNNLAERGKKWESLPTSYKNALLLDIFKEMRFEGNPPHEKLIIRFRTLREAALPVISVWSQNWGKGKFRRHLPNVEEWFDQATIPEI